jgi:hypothetical protein
MPLSDQELKQAALIGLRHERERIDNLIAQLERGLRGGHRAAVDGAAAPSPQKRRRLSAAARKRIIEGQRRRWAEFRAKQAAEAERAAAKKGPRKVARQAAGRKRAATKAATVHE